MTDTATTVPVPVQLNPADIMNLLIAAKAALPNLSDESTEHVSVSISRVRKALEPMMKQTPVSPPETPPAADHG